MVFIPTFLALAIALAVSPTTLVSAVPAQRDDTITIPVSKGSSGGGITSEDVVHRGRHRIDHYNHKHAHEYSGKAINKDVSYVARVSFCSQTFDLIVDTGSSNTWVRIMSLVLSSDSR